MNDRVMMRRAVIAADIFTALVSAKQPIAKSSYEEIADLAADLAKRMEARLASGATNTLINGVPVRVTEHSMGDWGKDQIDPLPVLDRLDPYRDE